MMKRLAAVSAALTLLTLMASQLAVGWLVRFYEEHEEHV